MKENTDFKMVAKTFFGLEEILADELLKLGAKKINIGVRNVSFYGDKGFLYKANLSLRTAIRILKPIVVFDVNDDKELYSSFFNFKALLLDLLKWIPIFVSKLTKLLAIAYPILVAPLVIIIFLASIFFKMLQQKFESASEKVS